MRIVFLFLIAFSFSLKAQTTTTAPQKIGFAEWEYIFNQLPEYKQIENAMKDHGTQLDNQMKAKYQEYDAKLKAYQAMPATTPEAIRADKERELQGLQENFQKFQQDAETSIRNKQTSLMEPVFKKVGTAIEDVAKENGYSFIINPQIIGGGDVLLYSDEKYNISNLVLKKLGITPVAVAPKTK
jgi:outer membrane protein